MPAARAARLRLEPLRVSTPGGGCIAIAKDRHQCCAPVPKSKAGPASPGPQDKAVQALRAGPTRQCRAGLCGPWFSPRLCEFCVLEPGRLSAPLGASVTHASPFGALRGLRPVIRSATPHAAARHRLESSACDPAPEGRTNTQKGTPCETPLPTQRTATLTKRQVLKTKTGRISLRTE